MILADKITEERKKNGWSQEELAEKLGVSRQSVSKWESAGSIPDLKKVIQMADLFGVSTDYLLREEMLPDIESPIVYCQTETETALRKISIEEANDFVDFRKKSAPLVADAVSLCILSPVVLIILGALSEETKFHITEGMAAAAGCTVLFSMIAAAVFIFITNGIRAERNEHLENECFETEYGVTGMIREKSRDYEGIYTRGIAVGAVLCIIAVVPLIIAGTMDLPDYIAAIFVGILLFLIATGVNMIIRVSMIKDCYDTLLQEGEFSVKKKKIREKQSALKDIYWCIVTVIYLAWSFWTMNWGFTWIVWPIAGASYAAICCIIKAVTSE